MTHQNQLRLVLDFVPLSVCWSDGRESRRGASPVALDVKFPSASVEFIMTIFEFSDTGIISPPPSRPLSHFSKMLRRSFGLWVLRLCYVSG